ncbi:MAG: hypothetical protein QM619_16145 [Micropruina sp.]|uniref:VOC family protein n=1 Tax=Micropruina sp. TaxID=2737536 RepID=UPI0039E364BA
MRHAPPIGAEPGQVAVGDVIGLNEGQDDLYGGYRVYEATTPPTLDVVAVCVTPDLKAEASYFHPFGFTAPSYDDPWWIGMRAGERSGVLGIHYGEPAPRDAEGGLRPDGDLFGPPYDVRIGFETDEALDELASRLEAAGVEPTRTSDEAGPKLVLTDPDGEWIEIHPTA